LLPVQLPSWAGSGHFLVAFSSTAGYGSGLSSASGDSTNSTNTRFRLHCHGPSRSLRRSRPHPSGPAVGRPAILAGRHINFLGRYLFTVQDIGPGQGLRPFRDPGTVEGAEDDD
jgi:hypothetical protein